MMPLERNAAETDVGSLCELLRPGLAQIEGLQGRCQIWIEGGRQIMALTATFEPAGAVIHAGQCAAPHATLRLPLWLLEKLLAEAASIDFRDPVIAGNVAISGDARLVSGVARALLKPPENVLAVFRRAAALSLGMAPLTAVPRFHTLPHHEVLVSIRAGRPFIVTGRLEGWLEQVPDVETLRTRFADEALLTRSAGETDTVAAFLAKMQQRAQTTDFAPIYTHGTELPSRMVPQFPPPYFEARQLTPSQIWLGAAPEGSLVTGLHRDPLAGMLGQVIGRKRVLLCPPHQADYLYPLQSFNSYQPCRVDHANPDYRRFPEFRHASFVELVLAPGELLVTPAGWFHCVYVLDRVVMSVSSFVITE